MKTFSKNLDAISYVRFFVKQPKGDFFQRRPAKIINCGSIVILAHVLIFSFFIYKTPSLLTMAFFLGHWIDNQQLIQEMKCMRWIESTIDHVQKNSFNQSAVAMNGGLSGGGERASEIHQPPLGVSSSTSSCESSRISMVGAWPKQGASNAQTKRIRGRSFSHKSPL